MNKDDAEKLWAERRAEGLKINPAIAEVTTFHVNYFDPYGICRDAMRADPDGDPRPDDLVGRLAQ